MLRNLLILLLVMLLFWVAVDLMLRDRQDSAYTADLQVEPPKFDLEPIVPPPYKGEANRVADISVHTVEELETLFDRVEQLLDRPRKEGEPPLITLVLHGPEVEFFALQNYETYKGVVDSAAKLAALGAVDIAICRTQMKSRGIGNDEVPTFLRQIPFGPDEVGRLVGDGYVSM